MNYSRLFNIAFVIWLTSIFSLGCIIGYDYGRIHERKTILERLEEVDSIRRLDIIRQLSDDKAMKQKIQLTSKNISDLFRLPCVVEIRKSIIMGAYGDYIPSPNLEDCAIYIVHRPLLSMEETRAEVGDWIVKDDNRVWHVEKGDKE